MLTPLILLGAALFILVGGEVVRLLWNALLPDLFGWPAIGFWRALGLLALCRILFGGLGLHGGGGSRWRGRMGERWERMTPEERARFREGLRGRCDLGSSPSGEGQGS